MCFDFIILYMCLAFIFGYLFNTVAPYEDMSEGVSRGVYWFVLVCLGVFFPLTIVWFFFSMVFGFRLTNR